MLILFDAHDYLCYIDAGYLNIDLHSGKNHLLVYGNEQFIVALSLLGHLSQN